MAKISYIWLFSFAVHCIIADKLTTHLIIMRETKDLEKALWAAAVKLWPNMDAAEYKHVVLGLIFLKNI